MSVIFVFRYFAGFKQAEALLTVFYLSELSRSKIDIISKKAFLKIFKQHIKLKMVEIDEVEDEENEKLENKIEKEDAKDSYSGLK